MTVPLATLLQAVTQKIQGDAEISALVDAEIHKDVPLELAGSHLKADNKTCILVNAAKWKSAEVSDDESASPMFQVAIVSRYGQDSSYPLNVADKVTSLLVPGIEETVDEASYKIDIQKIESRLSAEKKYRAWVALITLSARYPAQTAPTVTLLSPNLASSRPSGTAITWVCVASDPDSSLLYRFWLKGPGTASEWQDMTGWTRRNAWTWRTANVDVGESQVKVQVIDEAHAPGWEFDDQATSPVYTITASGGGGGTGDPPTISSLTPYPASPQVARKDVLFVCVASDPDNNEILYKFWLKGPGTASKWRDQTGWIRKNSWNWKSSDLDAGANQIKVDVIDGNHADRGSADDTLTIDYTISANTAPTISSLTVDPASPQIEGQNIRFVCIAAGGDEDELLYKFLLNGPATDSKLADQTGWSRKNVWTWKISKEDVGANTIYVQILDGNHADRGSYDDQKTLAFTVSANTAPTITSLTPDLASPQVEDQEINCVCVASGGDEDEIQYKFWLNGPATANEWQDMTGWTRKNAWKWKSSDLDVGANQIKIDVIDGNHADRGSFDDSETIDYSISANTAPTISSLTADPASPQIEGQDIRFVCIAAGGDEDELVYKFLLNGPATGGKLADQTGWARKNVWAWKIGKEDVGANTIYVQILDGNHADRGSYDDQKTLAFTVSQNTAPTITSLTPDPASPQTAGQAINFICVALGGDEDEIQYKFWLKGPGTGSQWADMTGWSRRNIWTWKPTEDDAGSNQVKVEIIDGNHADRGFYDDSETVNYTITALNLVSVTPSLASPQANETTIVFTAAANRTSNLVYRFWLKGPGTANVWRDMTGWIAKNSWEWRTKDCDVGSNTIRAQVIDKRSNWNDSETTGRQIDTAYTIS